jgi:hypothetical protein
MKTTLLTLFTLAALTAAAQTPAATTSDCDITSVETASTCQIGKMEGAFHRAALAKADTTESAASAAPKQALENATTNKVANSNRATTAPDTFAARIHNSYQDFLQPLSFAINKVEESKDGQALILRFNPIRQPPFNLGFTATAAKPTVADAVKKNIADANRDATVAKIEKEFGDFDDITLSASFTRTTAKCASLSDRCFGRNPEIYWDIISAPVVALAGFASTRRSQRASLKLRDDIADAFADVKPPIQQPGLKKLSEVPDVAKRQQLYEDARIAGEADIADTRAYLVAFKAAGLENLATLIDNQPEWALTGSFHDRGAFNGPDETSASFDYQVGLIHLTNIRQKLRNTACVAEADKAAVGEIASETAINNSCLTAALKDKQISSNLSDKIVVNVSYIKVNRYRLNDLGDISATGFTPVDLKRTSEWKAKGQWGRKLGFAVTDQRPRLDVSVEFHRTAKGGERTLNRFVSTATLTVPWSTSASFPVSLSYANKSEFISDARKKLSMHFGLSYRLPWEKKE